MNRVYHDSDKCSQQEAALAVSLMRLWESAHGTPAGNACVFIRPESVVAWIEAVLSPAERAVARTTDGHPLIQRYTDELLRSIQPELRSQIEAVTGRRITSGKSNVDVESGHVLCFFVLGESLAGPSSQPSK